MARCPGTGTAGVVLLCLFFSAPARAQTIDGLRSTYVVDGRGASIQETHVQVAPLPAPAPVFVNNVGQGPLWRQSDAGVGWIGRVVSIGDRGTQVFTEFDTAADQAELVSGFDTTPVSPLFSDPQIYTSDYANVDAAAEAGVLVACRQIPASGQSGPRNSFVSKYTVTGGLGWTYQFPTSTYGPARAMVSADGTRIVAGMLDSLGALRIAVFNPSSNVPIYTTSFVNGPQLRALLLSADGSTLYWASATTVNLWNTNTHQMAGSFILFNANDQCHTISADGGVFAYGGFNNVDVWERQSSGQYLRTYQWNWPGVATCGKIKVSGNGSTLVAGFNLWDTNLGVTIKALDVPTKTVTMSDTAVGAGSLQNVVSDLAVSASGDRFVAGLWGDEAGLVPELRFYHRDENAPVATYDYPGSVNAVDISPDGHRVGVATKAVHANLGGGGGAIELYAFEDEDFTMHGIPQVHETVTFEMTGEPSAPARLLYAPQPAITPFQFGHAGTLYLNRQTMMSTTLGMTGIHGHASHDFAMPTLSTLVGTTMCFQGMTLAPRRLTSSWIRLTVLP